MNPPAKQSADDHPGSFDAFKALAEKLIQVPKSEVDRKETEYQRQQSKKPKRGPKKK